MANKQCVNHSKGPSMSTMSTEYKDSYNEGYKRACPRNVPEPYEMPFNQSIADQPVGGRSAAKVMSASTGMERLAVHDEDFICSVMQSSDRGQHRVRQVQWMDPRWSDAMRAGSAVLYEPADHDPPNRTNLYVYRNALSVDPMDTPCKPLTVPDVHKLRYMQNNYMSPDDWY